MNDEETSVKFTDICKELIQVIHDTAKGAERVQQEPKNTISHYKMQAGQKVILASKKAAT